MYNYSLLRNKVLLLVSTCQNYSDRIETYYNTIGHHVDCIFCSDHIDKNMNVMKFSNNTDYNSNEEKQINAVNSLKCILSEKTGKSLLDSYQWFFFCDCDTFINLKKLDYLIDTFNVNTVHGYLINIDRHPTNSIFTNPKIPGGFEYLSGGAGFFVTRELINKVGQFVNYQTTYADVSMALNWYYNGIKVENIKVNNFVYHLNTKEALLKAGRDTICDAMCHLHTINNI